MITCYYNPCIAGILLSCSANRNLELCAMATAKLHALIQTRNMKDREEGAFLLYFMNHTVQRTIEGNCLCTLSPACLLWGPVSHRLYLPTPQAFQHFL